MFWAWSSRALWQQEEYGCSPKQPAVEMRGMGEETVNGTCSPSLRVPSTQLHLPVSTSRCRRSLDPVPSWCPLHLALLPFLPLLLPTSPARLKVALTLSQLSLPPQGAVSLLPRTSTASAPRQRKEGTLLLVFALPTSMLMCLIKPTEGAFAVAALPN